MTKLLLLGKNMNIFKPFLFSPFSCDSWYLCHHHNLVSEAMRWFCYILCAVAGCGRHLIMVIICQENKTFRAHEYLSCNICLLRFQSNFNLWQYTLQKYKEQNVTDRGKESTWEGSEAEHEIQVAHQKSNSIRHPSKSSALDLNHFTARPTPPQYIGEYFCTVHGYTTLLKYDSVRGSRQTVSIWLKFQ